MKRLARDRVVIFAWDPEHDRFWLVQKYFPEILELDRPNFPSVDAMGSILGPFEVRTVRIPSDCIDGFLGAYWQQPAAYLDAGARRAISSFDKLANVEDDLQRLEKDLAYGTWQATYRELLAAQELDIGYRLIVARLARA